MERSGHVPRFLYRSGLLSNLLVPVVVLCSLRCAALGTPSTAHSSAQGSGKASPGRWGNNSGDAFTALSDGSSTFVNKRWTEYTGLSVEQSSGAGWQRAIH